MHSSHTVSSLYTKTKPAFLRIFACSQAGKQQQGVEECCRGLEETTLVGGSRHVLVIPRCNIEGGSCLFALIRSESSSYFSIPSVMDHK